jgi:uncharacterized protein YbjQ (UPF0145 family)
MVKSLGEVLACRADEFGFWTNPENYEPLIAKAKIIISERALAKGANAILNIRTEVTVAITPEKERYFVTATIEGEAVVLKPIK